MRDDLQPCIIKHFGDDDGVFVGDETGFLKKGTESAGVGMACDVLRNQPLGM